MKRRNAFKAVLGCALYISHRTSLDPSRADMRDKPILKSFLMPSYPLLPRQAGSEGIVSVTIRISEQGLVESLTEFSGPKLFYDEINRCLPKWEFEALKTGSTELRMKFQFALRGRRDERCLHYQISGQLPNSFIIEANPFPNTYS